MGLASGFPVKLQLLLAFLGPATNTVIPAQAGIQ